jgi:hypothetical protein
MTVSGHSREGWGGSGLCQKLQPTHPFTLCLLSTSEGRQQVFCCMEAAWASADTLLLLMSHEGRQRGQLRAAGGGATGYSRA